VVNIRWGFIAGIAAFIISLAIGLIAGVNILHIFLRALMFLAVFFGIGFGLRFIIASFLPELLYNDDEPSPQSESEYSGRRVDITVGASSEYAVPNTNSSNENELGNIEDLISGIIKPKSGAIDRDIKDEYNYDGVGLQSGFSANDMEFSDYKPFSGNTGEKPLFTPSFAESGLSGLPDLDAMASVFSGGSSFVPGKEPVEEYTAADPVRTGPLSKNKPQQLKGDFDAKELAKGISTVLSKDKQ